MTRIRFDLDELARAEDAARTAVERIDGRLTDLRVALAPLHERWSGEAARAWASHQREWDVAAADLRAGLAELHRLLGVARANYASTVAANVRMWRGPARSRAASTCRRTSRPPSWPTPRPGLRATSHPG